MRNFKIAVIVTSRLTLTLVEADLSRIEDDIGKWLDHLAKSDYRPLISKVQRTYRTAMQNLLNKSSLYINVKINVVSARSACLNDACKVGNRQSFVTVFLPV